MKVAYPRGGPADQMFPDSRDAFGFLVNDDCAGLRSAVAEWRQEPSIVELHGTALDLYAGAAAACLNDWPTAEANLASVKPDDVTGCDRTIVLAYLEDMVEAHNTDPGTPPDTSGPGSTCPVPAGSATPNP